MCIHICYFLYSQYTHTHAHTHSSQFRYLFFFILFRFVSFLVIVSCTFCRISYCFISLPFCTSVVLLHLFFTMLFFCNIPFFFRFYRPSLEWIVRFISLLFFRSFFFFYIFLSASYAFHRKNNLQWNDLNNKYYAGAQSHSIWSRIFFPRLQYTIHFDFFVSAWQSNPSNSAIVFLFFWEIEKKVVWEYSLQLQICNCSTFWLFFFSFIIRISNLAWNLLTPDCSVKIVFLSALQNLLHMIEYVNYFSKVIKNY